MNLYESRRGPGGLFRRGRPLRRATGFLLALALGAAFVAFRYQAAAAKTSELAAIRARSLPVTPAELDIWYASPAEGQNAADLYQEAFRLLLRGAAPEEIRVPIVGTNVMPGPQARLSASDLASAEAFLTRHQQTIALLRQAARLPGCRFPVALHAGGEAELPHLRPLHDATRLLVLDAIVKAERNDGDGAAESLLDALGIARAVEAEPVLLSQRARIRDLSIALQGVERVLNRTKLTDHFLGRLGNALERVSSTSSLARAIAGERAIAMTAVVAVPAPAAAGGAPGLGESSAALSALGERFYAWSGARDLDLVFALRGYRDLVEAAGLPVHLRRVALDRISTRLDAIPSRYVVSRKLLPPVLEVARDELRAIALGRAARVAVAVEQFRLARTSLPETLDELVPEQLLAIPGDPFAPHPLRYDSLGVRYTVYSVGLDGKDDGGMPTPQAGDHRSGDIAFVVQR